MKGFNEKTQSPQFFIVFDEKSSNFLFPFGVAFINHQQWKGWDGNWQTAEIDRIDREPSELPPRNPIADKGKNFDVSGKTRSELASNHPQRNVAAICQILPPLVQTRVAFDLRDR